MTPVLHVIASNERRGAELFAVQLNEALGEVGLAGRVVALAPGGASECLDVPTLGSRRRGVSTFRALRREAHGAGVVVAHGSTTLPLCAVGLAGSGVPFVYRNIGDPAHWGTTRLRRLRSRAFLSRAAAVVALTADTAERVRATYGVAHDRLRVIPKGVPTASFPMRTAESRVAARRHFGLPAEARVVVFLGALGPEKRVDLAVQAVRALPGTHLAVFGDGPEGPGLAALAAQDPDRIHLMGTTARPALALAAADAVILPSATEGLPGVLIEAGLTGVPVVASDVGFVREIVEDGVTGNLVPPGRLDLLTAALATLLSQPQPADLAARARQRCTERFSLGTVAVSWGALLREVGNRNR